eukprot:1157689-Pelagomonas_calceolata.AAC.1
MYDCCCCAAPAPASTGQHQCLEHMRTPAAASAAVIHDWTYFGCAVSPSSMHRPSQSGFIMLCVPVPTPESCCEVPVQALRFKPPMHKGQ